MNLRVTFDQEADAAYIYLVPIGPGEAVRTEVLGLSVGRGAINVDFDREGHLIGIEVLSASLLLPAPVIASATPPGS